MNTDLRSNKVQKAFDQALKLIKGGDLDDGYKVDDRQQLYNNYYTNAEWKDFLGEMKNNYNTAYKAYCCGNGSELLEITRRGKSNPPKMASYASSSRFIYELSRDIPDFSFECKLPTSFPGYPASLDGAIISHRTFVEAKCHEIYSRNSSGLGKSYINFCNYFNENTNGILGLSGNKVIKWGGEQLFSLDLKQLLSHLFGIANNALQKNCEKISTLIYLVYRPEPDLLQLISDEKTKNHVLAIWKNEQDEARTVDFNLLFYHIVHYLYNNKKSRYRDDVNVDGISKAFKFVFCDQNEYKVIINKIIK